MMMQGDVRTLGKTTEVQRVSLRRLTYILIIDDTGVFSQHE